MTKPPQVGIIKEDPMKIDKPWSLFRLVLEMSFFGFGFSTGVSFIIFDLAQGQIKNGLVMLLFALVSGYYTYTSFVDGVLILFNSYMVQYEKAKTKATQTTKV